MPEPLTEILVSVCEAGVHMHGNHSSTEQQRLQLRALEMQLDHTADLADMQLSLAREFIRAMVDRRIDVVQSSFVAILATYADQARHYMAQHEKYVDADIKSKDPHEKTAYGSRISEMDRKLPLIRRESYRLYQEMNTMLLLIGDSMPPMGPTITGTLLLPQGGR